MFLVQSEVDNRAYIVYYENIVTGGKQEHEILKDDIVKFILNQKHHEGKVIEFSSNSSYLKTQRIKFNKMVDEKKKKFSAEVTTKRKPIPKRSWSPSNSPPLKKPKQPLEMTDNTKSKKFNESSESSTSSNISIESSDNEFIHEHNKKSSEELENISPSKDDLKKQIELLKAQKKEKLSAENGNGFTITPQGQNSHQSMSKKITSEKNFNQDELRENKSDQEEVKNKNDSSKLNESQDNEQLFSPNYDDGKMKHLGDDVYCREVIYTSALGASHKATHLARRLLEGVFKHEALMGCTLTGQAPRGTGKKLMVKPLDQRAKNAIVDFSMRIAIEKKWPSQNRGAIFKEMSQKLTEYKRDHNKKSSTQEK